MSGYAAGRKMGKNECSRGSVVEVEIEVKLKLQMFCRVNGCQGLGAVGVGGVSFPGVGVVVDELNYGRCLWLATISNRRR